MTVVVTALVAGAGAGASGAVSTAVLDAYNGLKALVLRRLPGGGVGEDDEHDGREGHDLVAGSADQPARRAELTEELSRVGVDEPTVRAAQRLLELLEGQQGKNVADASHAKGVIVGDHAVQYNTFN